MRSAEMLLVSFVILSSPIYFALGQFAYRDDNGFHEYNIPPPANEIKIIDEPVDSLNLPPSIDETKKTLPGTVQGVVRLDGSYEEGLRDKITLNRTRAFLNCTSGSMKVDLTFREPFFGLAYADFDRRTSCRINGDGRLLYTIELPLKGCGTIQDPPRVFINNIVVRFHPELELDGDEVITIVCRYGPPFAPPPIAPVFPILSSELPPLETSQVPLKELEILLIICAILFLAFLLLGMACSYFCLKKRNIRILTKKKGGADSEITKFSSSPICSPSIFDDIRIPRAHTVPADDMEANLIKAEHSDTMASDYPSESPSSLHSEVGEIDIHPKRGESTVSSSTLVGAEEKSTEVSSYEQAAMFTSGFVQADSVPPEPRFDVAIRVKETECLPPERERTLSTISEKEEYFRRLDELSEIDSASNLRPAKLDTVPPLYAIVKKKEKIEKDMMDYTSYVGTDFADYSKRKPTITSHSIDDVYRSTITETKTYEHNTKHFMETTEMQSKPIPDWDVLIRSYPPADVLSDGNGLDSFSDTTTERTNSVADIRESFLSARVIKPSLPPKNWEVLIRVLSPLPEEDSSILTIEDREKWKEIITTESTLRTMLTKASIREDFERIRRDQRFEKVFEPQKWDVIIRVLNPPEESIRGDDTESECSIEPVHIHRYPNVNIFPQATSSHQDMRLLPANTIEKISHSSAKSDLRSMTEEVVDFSQIPSGTYGGFTANISQYYRYIYGDQMQYQESNAYSSELDGKSGGPRSLARSGSEITEDWTLHPREFFQHSFSRSNQH